MLLTTPNGTRGCELEFDGISSTIHRLFAAGFFICSVIAVVGNVIALYILVRPSSQREARRNSDKILVSLVINDLLIGFVVAPFLGFEQLFSFYQTFCHEQAAIISSLYTISSVNIAFIAYYRCRTLVTHVDCERYLETFNVKIMITAWWLVLPVICVSFYIIGLRPYVFLLSLIFVVTLSIVCVSYIVIVRVIRQVKRTLLNAACQETVERYQIGKKVVVFIMCFILCFLPMVAMLIVNIVFFECGEKRPKILQLAFLLGDFMVCLNSCLNPWVYTLKYPLLKQKLEKRRRRKELMKRYAVVIH